LQPIATLAKISANSSFGGDPVATRQPIGALARIELDEISFGIQIISLVAGARNQRYLHLDHAIL
jgi:hypothetical protein